MTALNRAVDRLGSRGAVAQALGVSPRTVDGWASGRLPERRLEQLEALAEGRAPLFLDVRSIAERSGYALHRVWDWLAGRRSPRAVELAEVLLACPELRRDAHRVVAELAARYRAQHPT